jgi:pseudouridine-5'-phosphate glycosidase
MTTSPSLPMTFAPDVASARAAGTPIVALESTIITHGMPYPQNVDTARLVEADIRAGGATPATIAVIDGTLHIGLTNDQLNALGQAKNVAKLSRADIAACIATGGTGATTVAATMISAHLAGIKVFATGGIGGVHKGAETTFDISADLHELARTSVTVVAAGAKAILDLEKTYEVLETLGVPVIVFGQDTLPAFWSATSTLPAPRPSHRFCWGASLN